MVTNATVPQDLSSNINQGSLCGESLHAYKAKLEECNERVKTETCVEEIIDFYHCVDHCAAIEIFKAKFTNFAQTELVDLTLSFIVERKINRRGMYAMKLIEKIEQLHETGLFLFAHPSSEHCLGLPKGQGLNILFCNWWDYDTFNLYLSFKGKGKDLYKNKLLLREKYQH